MVFLKRNITIIVFFLALFAVIALAQINNGGGFSGGAVTNVVTFPDGTASLPAMAFTSQPAMGWYRVGTSVTGYGDGTHSTPATVFGAGILFQGSGGQFGFSNTANNGSATVDTEISRSAAGVLAVGATQSAGDTTGRVKAAGYMSVGTTFTTNAGCGEGAGVGGATAGKITTSGSTSCTTIITMGNAATAPNGWDCHAADITTAGDAANPHITATSPTTATIVSGTIVASDVIQFSCIGY